MARVMTTARKYPQLLLHLYLLHYYRHYIDMHMHINMRRTKGERPTKSPPGNGLKGPPHFSKKRGKVVSRYGAIVPPL